MDGSTWHISRLNNQDIIDVTRPVGKNIWPKKPATFDSGKNFCATTARPQLAQLLKLIQLWLNEARASILPQNSDWARRLDTAETVEAGLLKMRPISPLPPIVESRIRKIATASTLLITHPLLTLTVSEVKPNIVSKVKKCSGRNLQQKFNHNKGSIGQF